MPADSGNDVVGHCPAANYSSMKLHPSGHVIVPGVGHMERTIGVGGTNLTHVQDCAKDGQRAIIRSKLSTPVEIDIRVDRAKPFECFSVISAKQANASDRAASNRVGVSSVIAAGEP